MAAKNYLSDYQIFTSGMHGIASKHPRMKEVMLSEHLMPHNLLFQCSSAFWFKTATGAGNDSIVESLWNGTDDTSGAVGDAKFSFNPGFTDPTALARGIIPIITFGDMLLLGANQPPVQTRVIMKAKTLVANYLADVTITVVDDAGVGLPGVEGWALFIGKRAHWKHTIATPVSGKIFDGNGPNGENFQTSPLVGGVQVD